MAFVLRDRVQQTTATTGTGTITLNGAVAGYQAFSAIGNANTCYYTVVSGVLWESGIGTYTLAGTTLARTTILASSSGTTAITLAGTSTVFCGLPAGQQIPSAAYLTGVAGTNTITASLPVMGAYIIGQVFTLVPVGANTGAVTLNINSRGAIAVTQNNAQALIGGELVAGAAYQLVYDGTRFLFSNPVPPSGYLRNRLINGDMRIDQRNNGASVSNTAGGPYTLDRWKAFGSVASKFTIQRLQPASLIPQQFYLACTSSSAYALLAADTFDVLQFIESDNVADLQWGTANARSITISFRVFSSLIGTFGGSIRNSALNRSYVFTYSIPVASTWTDIKITIPGDTTGTWLLNGNGVGVQLCFSIGTGTTFSTTAGAWTAGNFISATGAVSVVSTLSATWYITGVQLEVGSIATPFEQRLLGLEMMLCQRYFVQWTGGAGTFDFTAVGTLSIASATTANLIPILNAPLRATPTVAFTGTNSVYDGVSSYPLTSVGQIYTIPRGNTTACWMVITASTGAMTAGRGGFMYTQNAATHTFSVSSEL